MPFLSHSTSRLVSPSAPCRRRVGVLVVVCAFGISVATVARWLAPRRFVVADHSMEPTLVDGQGLIGVRPGRVRVGQLRTFEHPDRSAFWLVKRVTAVSGASMIVESDNRDIPTQDSRSFGPVDVAGSYRVAIIVSRRWT